MSQIAGDSVAGQSMPSEATTKVTKALLACGVIAGPLFMVVSLVQAFTRPGFDLKRHAISMLSLGDLGQRVAGYTGEGKTADHRGHHQRQCQAGLASYVTEPITELALGTRRRRHRGTGTASMRAMTK